MVFPFDSSEVAILTTELVGAAAARISRYEGMEAHARTGDVRLRKYGYSN